MNEEKKCDKKHCNNPAQLNLACLVSPVTSESPMQVFTETYVCRQCASDNEAKVILNKSPSVRSEISKAFIRAGMGIPDLRGARCRWAPMPELEGVKPNLNKKPEIILH